MRLLLVFIGFMILFLLSCKKDQEAICLTGLEEGRIIGYDFRKCACCGGYWIEVGKDTLRSFTLPENIKTEDWEIVSGAIDIPVCLSYKKATDCQIGEELIDIGEMVLQ